MKIPLCFFSLKFLEENPKKVAQIISDSLKKVKEIEKARDEAIKEIREKIKARELQGQPVDKEKSLEEIKIEERYKQRIARIKFHESGLLKEVKRQNDELRKIIKRFGWLAVLPFIILAILTKQHNWLMGVFVFFAACVGLYMLGKYQSLNNKNIITCDSCFREFVPKENDDNMECPYCGQRHSANYV